MGRHWIGLYTSKLEHVAFKRVSLLNEQPKQEAGKNGMRYRKCRIRTTCGQNSGTWCRKRKIRTKAAVLKLPFLPTDLALPP